MQVVFKRWCMKEEEHGLPLSINPKDVVSTESFHPEVAPDTLYPGSRGYDAGTRITLRKGKEYFVQGSVEDVATLLNATEAQEESVQ